MPDQLQRLEQLVSSASDISSEIEEVTSQIENRAEEKRQKAVEELRMVFDMDGVDDDAMEAFAEEPYVMLPKAENEVFIAVPKFIPFNFGWLDRQTDSYNVFVVNKYIDWIEELPADIRDKVGIDREFEDPEVRDGSLYLSDEEEAEEAWNELGGRSGGLWSKEGNGEIKIKNGSEFDVIASLIEKGNLPFSAQPVPEEEIRAEPTGVSLRDYQERAWEKFTETGMVGVYWPPGAGKTFLALYAGDRIPGDKLVVVPSSTLESQWEERIDELVTHPNEWEVRTYQYMTYGNNMEDYTGASAPSLTVFDECHTLPANTFSKLATLDTDYRMGLSASPFREDGRIDYIFALTGFPVGLKWQELIDIGVVETPDADLYLYSTSTRKRRDVENIVSETTGKIIVFCDSIARGTDISSMIDAPFVSGDTPKGERMDIFRDNRVVVSSRVGDEGVSLPNLDVVVEYDFHGSSRRQEVQRYGRVMHGDSEGQHIIMMTDDEYEDYGERLHSLEEQGINIRPTRRL